MLLEKLSWKKGWNKKNIVYVVNKKENKRTVSYCNNEYSDFF